MHPGLIGRSAGRGAANTTSRNNPFPDAETSVAVRDVQGCHVPENTVGTRPETRRLKRSRGREHGRRVASVRNRARPAVAVPRTQDKHARQRARQIFGSEFARSGDYRAAAREAGVSERTGRRWQLALATCPPVARTTAGGALPAAFVQPTSFVGRAEDLRALETLFHEGARLVTVFGPPGIGKTRLAQQYVRRTVSRSGRPGPGSRPWATAGLFCDLREANTADDLCHALARTLHMHRSDATNPVEEVAVALAARGPCTVVLDNFERLTDAGPVTLHHWLRWAPEIRFLVTSRRVLSLEGDHVYELGSLSLPGEAQEGDCDAMNLFWDRARAVDSSVATTGAHRAAAEALVRRLEGIPLAIELAAGLMRHTTPAELLARFDRPVLDLQHANRDVERRHATMRAAIFESWSMLTPRQQRALACLSVFRHGFDLEAAHAVICTGEPSIDETRTVIAQLRDMALLVATPSSGVQRRWDTYQSIREYGAEQLEAIGGGASTRTRHADYFLAWGELRVAELETSKVSAAREALRVERENLRGAHDWCLTQHEVDPSDRPVRLGLVLYYAIAGSEPLLVADALARTPTDRAHGDVHFRFLVAQASVCRALGRYSEARNVLNEANRLTPSDPNLMFEHLLERGAVEYKEGRPEAAVADFEQALWIAEETASPVREGRALFELGYVRSQAFRDPTALASVERAAALFRQARDESLEVRARWFACHHKTSFQLGAPPFDDLYACLADAQRHQDRWVETNCMITLGIAAQESGDQVAAEQWPQRAVELAQRSNLRYSAACAQLCCGTAAEDRGDLQRALAWYSTSVETSRAIGSDTLSAIGEVARSGPLAALSDPEAARANLRDASQLLRGRKNLAWHEAELQEARLDLIELGRSPSFGLDHAREAQKRVQARVREATSPGVAENGRSMPPRSCRILLIRVILRSMERLRREGTDWAPTVRVESSGRGFQVGDAGWVSIPEGPVLPKLLLTLAESRAMAPGAPLTVESIVT